jgi:hypothetical protein
LVGRSIDHTCYLLQRRRCTRCNHPSTSLIGAASNLEYKPSLPLHPLHFVLLLPPCTIAPALPHHECSLQTHYRSRPQCSNAIWCDRYHCDSPSRWPISIDSIPCSIRKADDSSCQGEARMLHLDVSMPLIDTQQLVNTVVVRWFVGWFVRFVVGWLVRSVCCWLVGWLVRSGCWLAQVSIAVNGAPVDLTMKLGAAGEAYFVQESQVCRLVQPRNHATMCYQPCFDRCYWLCVESGSDLLVGITNRCRLDVGLHIHSDLSVIGYQETGMSCTASPIPCCVHRFAHCQCRSPCCSIRLWQHRLLARTCCRHRLLPVRR